MSAAKRAQAPPLPRRSEQQLDAPPDLFAAIPSANDNAATPLPTPHSPLTLPCKLNESESFADLQRAVDDEGLQPSGKVLIERWGVSPSEVSKRLAEWRAVGIIEMEMRGLERVVVAVKANFVRIVAPAEHAHGFLAWLLVDEDGIASGIRMPAGELYRSYERWARDYFTLPISRQVLVRALVGAGCRRCPAEARAARWALARGERWKGEWLELPERYEVLAVTEVMAAA